MAILYCRICGKPFEYNGHQHPLYCGRECMRERDRLSKQRSLQRVREKARAQRAMPKGTLNQKLKTLKERGMTYAEAQIADTLARVPRIGGEK